MQQPRAVFDCRSLAEASASRVLIDSPRIGSVTPSRVSKLVDRAQELGARSFGSTRYSTNCDDRPWLFSTFGRPWGPRSCIAGKINSDPADFPAMSSEWRRTSPPPPRNRQSGQSFHGGEFAPHPACRRSSLQDESQEQPRPAPAPSGSADCADTRAFFDQSTRSMKRRRSRHAEDSGDGFRWLEPDKTRAHAAAMYLPLPPHESSCPSSPSFIHLIISEPPTVPTRSPREGFRKACVPSYIRWRRRQQTAAAPIGAVRKERTSAHATSVAPHRDCFAACRTRPIAWRYARRASRARLSSDLRQPNHAAMMPTLLAAKAQKGMSLPSCPDHQPAERRPAARPILKAKQLAAVAPVAIRFGAPAIGIVAPHAGEIESAPRPSMNVVASRSGALPVSRETIRRETPWTNLEDRDFDPQ